MGYEERMDAASDYDLEQQSEGTCEEKERISNYLNSNIKAIEEIKHLFPLRKEEFKIKLEIYKDLLSFVEGD